MTIDAKTLLGLPVETQSGEAVGRVHGFRLDPLSHAILQYEVRRHGILKEIIPTTLLIHQNQVLSMTDKRMVVEDLVAGEKEAERGISRAAATPSSP
jgi:uncharacterized protein YrrD